MSVGKFRVGIESFAVDLRRLIIAALVLQQDGEVEQECAVYAAGVAIGPFSFSQSAGDVQEAPAVDAGVEMVRVVGEAAAVGRQSGLGIFAFLRFAPAVVVLLGIVRLSRGIHGSRPCGLGTLHSMGGG